MNLFSDSMFSTSIDSLYLEFSFNVLMLFTTMLLFVVFDIISTSMFSVLLAVISSSAGYFFDVSLFQCTFIILSSVFLMFGHVSLCIDIPFPFVIYPSMFSPGTGLQHEAIFILILSIPSTIMSCFTFICFIVLFCILSSTTSSFVFSSFIIIFIIDYFISLLFPMFIYRSSKSFSLYVFNIF